MKTDKPEITRESIARKLGIDPLNPPMPEGDPDEIDDASPSIWAPLTKEEKAFVFEQLTGDKFPL